MRLEAFPVIKEIFRIYQHTRSIINCIDPKTPILPRFTDADDFHDFLGKCCVCDLADEVWHKVDPKKVETIKKNDLDKFLPSTQHLLNRFHQRYK